MDTLNARPTPGSQRGFVLVMTLMILVILVLSGIALMTIMRAGVSTAGNIAFRQAAVRVADVAAEEAFQWVSAQIGASAAALESTDTSTRPGYYASAREWSTTCSTQSTTSTAKPDFLPHLYDFSSTSCAMAHAGPVSGYNLAYVVHRMAAGPGACPAAGCSGPSVTVSCPTGSSHESGADSFCSSGGSTTSVHVYYRVTIKVSGPQHNTRYVQTFFY